MSLLIALILAIFGGGTYETPGDVPAEIRAQIENNQIPDHAREKMQGKVPGFVGEVDIAN